MNKNKNKKEIGTAVSADRYRLRLILVNCR